MSGIGYASVLQFKRFGSLLFCVWISAVCERFQATHVEGDERGCQMKVTQVSKDGTVTVAFDDGTTEDYLVQTKQELLERIRLRGQRQSDHKALEALVGTELEIE